MNTKRIRNALLALLLCITMILSLTACGGSGDKGSSKMEEFIESAQDEVASMQSSFGDDMEIKLEARGNSLAYVFQYKIDTGMDNDAMAEALETALDAMSSTFTSILSALKTAVPDAESVIVEYQDKDGNVILTKDFK